MNNTRVSPDYSRQIDELALQAGSRLKQTKQKLVTVESCTGGGIAQAITRVPGSSDWFDCGFVTYSNSAKQQLVDVDPALIQVHGAVSEPVAEAMARGGLERSAATICLSVTGIAGPDGGTDGKPVGTVCFGRADGTRVSSTTKFFGGDREQIRNQSILFALSDWLGLAD